MRSLTLAVAALCLLGAASAYYSSGQPTHVDDVLIRQKKMYQLVYHVNQPLLNADLIAIANSFDIGKYENHFKKPEVVRTFRIYLAHGYFQKRGEKFSIYTESGKRQYKALFELLYYAKDFETFYRSAVWAREYLNEDLFVIALYTVMNFRHDTRDIVMPPLFEVMPWQYFNSGVIYKAYRAALEGKTYNRKHPYVIPVDYNCSYSSIVDSVMGYYTEDVYLLALEDRSRFKYPYWARLGDYHQSNYTRRGDFFYYTLKIMKSRLYLERLSYFFPEPEPINYEEPVCRDENYSPLIENIKVADRRLRDAADLGYVYDNKWRKYSLRDPEGSDIYAGLVEGNADSVDIKYYRTFYYDLLTYGQKYIDCCNEYTVGQCGFNRPNSIFFSPVFFSIVNRVLILLDYYKDGLGPYQHKELLLPGVTVKGLTFDKLLTYYEYFDVDVSNAVPVPNLDVAHKLAVVARTRRLNHKPFSYSVHVHSDREKEVVVRVWIAPSCDIYGRELSLNQKRHYMYFLDSFSCKLHKGKNQLVRHSHQFIGEKVERDFWTLISTTDAALAHKSHPSIDDFYREEKYNSHVKLPRGYFSGLKITTAVVITQLNPHGSSWTNPGPDDYTYFPWDREMDEIKIHTVPNIYFGEEKVFHSKSGEWKSDEAVAA